MSTHLRTRSVQVALAILFGIWLLHASFSQSSYTVASSWSSSTTTKHRSSPITTGTGPIGNGTLGFQAIYAIGLPERTDKRDAMALAATLTDLKLTWMDGVRGDKISVKAAPPEHHKNRTSIKSDAELGCWRAHMNVWRSMVENGVGSALILEDDADWDAHIVHQMEQFAASTREITSQKKHRTDVAFPRTTDSPYGEGWDILWIGNCGGWYPAPGLGSSIIKGDNTVPPSFDIVDLLAGLPEDDRPCAAHKGRGPKRCRVLRADERFVQEGSSPLCTTGYALSQQGARKFLARLGGTSLRDVEEAIDVSMSHVCNDYAQRPGEKTMCVTASPPYFRQHKARGPLSADTDIQKQGEFDSVWERDVGVSGGLVWSTRINIENLLSGWELESQYVVDAKTKEWRYRKADEYRQS